MMSSASTRSSTERAIGPRTARYVPAQAGTPGGVCPRKGTRSKVGLWAQTPQKCAGTRSEPPMSLPSDRGPKPAASAADDPPEEPPGERVLSQRIVRRPVDVVVALPVAEAERHIGLAENDCARRLEAAHGKRVFRRDEVLGRGYAPGRWQSGNVVGFLDRDGHAEQRQALAARKRRVRLLRRLAGAGEIAHRYGVQVAVESLDPGYELFG